MQYAACGPFCATCHGPLNVGPCNTCDQERLSYVLDGYEEHWMSIAGFWLSEPVGPKPSPTGVQALTNLYSTRYPRGAIFLNIDLTVSTGITALFWFTPGEQPRLVESPATAVQLLYMQSCKGFAILDCTLRELDVMYGFL